MGSDQKPKTFIKLPPDEISYLFVPVLSSASDEIKAHMSMFNPLKTDHYYELGSDSISLINEMVARFQRKQLGLPPKNYPYYPPPTAAIEAPPTVALIEDKPKSDINQTLGKQQSIPSDTSASDVPDTSASTSQQSTPYYPPPPSSY